MNGKRICRAGLLLTLCACLTLSLLSACRSHETGAETADTAEGAAPVSGEVWELPCAGVTVPIPAAYLEAQDRVYMEAADECYAEDGISYGYIGFYPASYDELERMSEDEIYDLIGKASYPLTVFGIDGGRGEDELRAWLNGDGWFDPTEMTELGRAGEWTFFRVSFGDSAGDYDAQTADIARRISESLADTSGFRFSEPDPSAGQSSVTTASGQVSFSTTDVYGNAVESAELFASNEITMVNVWASWCPPCKAEMPELEQIAGRIAEKNCGLIGILYDADTGSGLEDGIAVMEEAGVTFPVLVPDSGIFAGFPIYAFPTTFFVDAGGNLVGEPVVGAMVEQYESILEGLLG